MTLLMVGEARERLRELPDESVHCVVTSPPYWGLRDYGMTTWTGGDPNCDHAAARAAAHQGQGATSARVGRTNVAAQREKNHRGDRCPACGAVLTDNGMIGLEPSIDEHVRRLVEVFREVRRVLRSDGTVWLNYGDAYASGMRKRYADDRKNRAARAHDSRPPTPAGIKPKDLLMMPFRIASALQEDGWWVRSEIVWSKANPMPESVRDRPTSAHEKVWLLTKSGRERFWTHPAVPGVRTERPEPDYVFVNDETGEETASEPIGWRDNDDWRRVNRWVGHDYYYDAEAVRTPAVGNGGAFRPAAPERTSYGRGQERGGPTAAEDGANLRNVWTFPTAPYPGAHFATFPPALVEPCIRAGTSGGGVCDACGAPRWRQTEVRYRKNRPSAGNDPRSRSEDRQAQGSLGGHHGWRGNNFSKEVETTGWLPTCDCGAAVRPAVVLDPFAGAGTVAVVAQRLTREAILIEINPKYARMAQSRIDGDVPLFSTVTLDTGAHSEQAEQAEHSRSGTDSGDRRDAAERSP